MGPAGNRGRFRWERASWCCSQIVARVILPPKARQRAVYLGNVGSLQRHADGNPEENGFGIPPHDGPGRQSGRGPRLPGLDEKDVEVLVDDDVLTIRGEKKSETQDQERRVSE